MNGYEKDILSQPEDIRLALDYYMKNGYAGKLLAIKPETNKRIIFTGMGSSYLSCYNVVTALRNSGLCVMKIPASQLLHFEAGAITEDSLLVCVSQSGESAEIAALLKTLPDSANIIGVTNDVNSTLGKRANLVLDMHVGAERSVSTRTYLASLAINHIMAQAFCANADGYGDIGASVRCLEEFLTDFEAVSKSADEFLSLPPYLAVIARGRSLCAAEAGALYLMETAKFPAIAFDAGQFRHGPLELTAGEFHAVVFAPVSGCYDLQIKIARQIAGNGGKVLLVTDSAYRGGGNINVITQRYSCADLEGFVNISVMQIIANNFAKRKGLEVGEFFFSSKVTAVQ